MNEVQVYCLEDLGEHIRYLRKQKGYSQYEFAKLLGTSHATLSKMENGTPVNCALIEKALQILGQKLVIVPKKRNG